MQWARLTDSGDFQRFMRRDRVLQNILMYDIYLFEISRKSIFFFLADGSSTAANRCVCDPSGVFDACVIQTITFFRSLFFHRRISFDLRENFFVFRGLHFPKLKQMHELHHARTYVSVSTFFLHSLK